MSQPDWGLQDDIKFLLATGGVPARLAGRPELRHLFRADPALLAAALRQLGDFEELSLLAARAADPNTHPAALRLLAGICPAAFCANPVLPLLLLEDPGLPAAFDPASLGRLLAYPGVPAELVAAIAQVGHPEQAAAARLHIALPPAVPRWRDELAQVIAALPVVPEDDLLAVLVALGAVPTWLLPRIAASPNERLAAALVAAHGDWSALAALDLPAAPLARPERSLDELEQMLNHEAPAVRAAAAGDPQLAPERLLQVKHDEDWSDVDPAVYRALASNPQSSPALLSALAADRSALFAAVRRAIAHNPHAPPEALALLADEPYATDLRLTVAAHPNLSPAQRAQLLAHSLEHALGSLDPVFGAIALSQPALPVEQFTLFAGSPYWLERLALALNPATPQEVRAPLADDGNRLVRAAAREPRSNP